MMHFTHKTFIKIVLSTTLACMTTHATPPQITVIFIIDQFAFHYLYKIKPYLTGGIKMLLDNGVQFENAHHPHAMPETAVGHAALNTGTLAKDHGIIADYWVDPASGKQIESDEDDPITAGVFGPNNTTYTYGKGPSLLAIDGLSDQFVLQSRPHTPHKAFALSIKSRAAVLTAGKLAKAVWFDTATGLFTSSKAYYDKLPSWITKFNEQKKVDKLTSVQWDLFFAKTSKAYDFYDIKNYTCSSIHETRIGKPIAITQACKDKNTFEPVILSPLGDKLVLDLAHACIEQHLTPNTRLLLWLSLSCLDLVGHRYGPDSLEALDMIYHLDKELKNFMHYVQKKVGHSNVLFALTADHGVVPLHCVLQDEGIKNARKIATQEIIDQMNKSTKKNHGIDALITNCQMPQFYFDRDKIKKLPEETYNKIMQDLKTFLINTPGIKMAWSATELDTLPFDPEFQTIERFFKMQRYPGRSGDLFVQVEPFTIITRFAQGTTHESPYNYDTHVPLTIYKQGEFEHKKIFKRVYTTQFANTMAQILQVGKPSASTFELLPGIFG